MIPPHSPMRELAGRLLAANRTVSGPDIHDVVLLNVRLRALLIRIIGKEGFFSLQRRALMLAKSDVPALQIDKLEMDGRLTRLEELDRDMGTQLAMAVTTHLLELLVSVIGEPLTSRLLQDAWSDSSLDE